MPFHRAYFATAAEAREKAATAVARLSARWEAATTEAGAETPSTAPTIGVRIDSIERLWVANPVEGSATIDESTRIDVSAVRLRATGPDGRSEIADVVIPTAQADALFAQASGAIAVTSTVRAKVTLRSRVARRVQVAVSAATTIASGQRLVDRNTEKVYTVDGAWPLAAAGTYVIDVVEHSASDLSDVTYGSVMEFVTPPAEVAPLARVCSMRGFTIVTGDELRDAIGRRYTIHTGLVFAETAFAYTLSGYLEAELEIVRDLADGLDPAPLEVGAALTLTSPPTYCSRTGTCAAKGAVSVPAGTRFVRATTSHAYLSTADVEIGDSLEGEIPVLAEAVGPAYDLKDGTTVALSPADTLDFVTPIAGLSTSGTVVPPAIPAASLPEPYAPQVVGGPLTWTSRVHQVPDGRWAADVYTLPIGS